MALQPAVVTNPKANLPTSNAIVQVNIEIGVIQVVQKARSEKLVLRQISIYIVVLGA
jgi:hypothetical protein